MKSSTMRIGKRIMAVMLSLMMVAGIFAGMKLDVRAAISYVFDVTNPKQIEIAKTKTYQPGDCFEFANITIPDNNTYSFEQRYDFYAGSKYLESKHEKLNDSSSGKDTPYTYAFFLFRCRRYGLFKCKY